MHSGCNTHTINTLIISRNLNIISIFAGSLIDNHPGITGYRYFFIFLTIVIAIGLVLILIWKAYLKHAKIDKSKMDEKAMEELKQYV